MSNQIGFNSGSSCNGAGGDYCLPELDYTVKPTVRVTGKTGYCEIKVQMWDTIGCEEDNIVRVYNEGDCVCLDGKYYFSKIDKNLDKPGVDTTTWSEGYSQCDLLNPLLDKYISDASISGRTITITRSDGETFDILLPEDKDTYGHVLNNGDGTYTWINADGSTGDSWTGSPHPQFPDDVHVTDFTIDGDVATVTLSDGTSFTQAITHPSGSPEKYIVDAVIDPVAGTITYTYNDGTSFTKPHPAGVGGGASFEQDLNDATGKLTTTVDDTTKVVNVADPSLFPSGAIHAVDNLPTALGTGDIEPVPLYRDGTEEASGGVTVSDTGITLPKAGRWHIHIRVLAQLHDVANNLTGSERTKVQLIKPNGDVATAIKYETADFIAIPEAQDKREINQKHITKFLEAGEYHWKIVNSTAKVNINSIQSDFIFISNETDEN